MPAGASKQAAGATGRAAPHAEPDAPQAALPAQADLHIAGSAAKDADTVKQYVQGFTDAAVKRIDEALKTKEQEIMQV